MIAAIVSPALIQEDRISSNKLETPDLRIALMPYNKLNICTHFQQLRD